MAGDAINHDCHECDKSFKNEHNLAQHYVATHKQLKIFPCPKCGLKYSRPWTMSRHALDKHGLQLGKGKGKAIEGTKETNLKRRNILRRARKDHQRLSNQSQTHTTTSNFDGAAGLSPDPSVASTPTLNLESSVEPTMGQSVTQQPINRYLEAMRQSHVGFASPSSILEPMGCSGPGAGPFTYPDPTAHANNALGPWNAAYAVPEVVESTANPFITGEAILMCTQCPESIAPDMIFDTPAELAGHLQRCHPEIVERHPQQAMITNYSGSAQPQGDIRAAEAPAAHNLLGGIPTPPIDPSLSPNNLSDNARWPGDAHLAPALVEDQVGARGGMPTPATDLSSSPADYNKLQSSGVQPTTPQVPFSALNRDGLYATGVGEPSFYDNLDDPQESNSCPTMDNLGCQTHAQVQNQNFDFLGSQFELDHDRFADDALMDQDWWKHPEWQVAGFQDNSLPDFLL